MFIEDTLCIMRVFSVAIDTQPFHPLCMSHWILTNRYFAINGFYLITYILYRYLASHPPTVGHINSASLMPAYRTTPLAWYLISHVPGGRNPQEKGPKVTAARELRHLGL